MKFILDETQLCRDKELAKLLKLSLSEVQSLPIATPDAIRIYDGKKELSQDQYISLYKNYEYLNFPAYLRTLMQRSVQSRHPELFALLRNTKNKVCLDFGSGCGSHSIALCQNDNDVAILDVPGKLMDFARMRLNSRDFFPRVYFNDTPLPDNFFDVVICSDTLEHVAYPVEELKRIHKCMKPNGIIHLLVSTMQKDSSGHFKESIDNWKTEGVKYLKEVFVSVGKTIYKKK